MGVLQMEWRIGEKVCGGWVCTIFCWWCSNGGLGIWTIVGERRWNFGTLWKLVGFFTRLLLFHFMMMMLHFEGSCNRKKNNIFCCSNFKHHIINFCSHYCCCRTFELLLLLLWLFWKQIKEEICRKNVSHQNVILSGV